MKDEEKSSYDKPTAMRLGFQAKGTGLCNVGTSETTDCASGPIAAGACSEGVSVPSGFCIPGYGDSLFCSMGLGGPNKPSPSQRR